MDRRAKVKLELNEEELERLLQWYETWKYPNDTDKLLRRTITKQLKRLREDKEAIHHYFTNYGSRLDTRIMNSFYRMGLWHMEDVAAMTHTELLNINGIGLSAVVRINEVSRKYREGKK